MMFPSLDVDFPFDWLIRPDSRVGQAQACVEIGAPFLEKPRQFWARLASPGHGGDFHHVLLRPVEAEESRIFVALYGYRHQENLEDFWKSGLTSTQSGDAPISGLSRFSGLSRCWRDKNQEVGVLFRLCGGPILNWPNNGSGSYHEPQKWTFEEFIEWRTDDLHRFLEQQWADERSQMRLTWKWSQLSLREKCDAMFVCERGRWSVALRVLSRVLKSEGLVNREIAEFGASWEVVEPGETILIRNERLKKSAASPRLQAWQSAILKIFKILRLGENVPQLIGEHLVTGTSVGCGPLSHHEILEARQQLNAWARKNLAPDEAERLIAMESQF